MLRAGVGYGLEVGVTVTEPGIPSARSIKGGEVQRAQRLGMVSWLLDLGISIEEVVS